MLDRPPYRGVWLGSGLIRRFAVVLDRRASWLAIPIALLLLFPSPWMSVGFIAVLGLFTVRWVAKTRPLPATQANLAILILLAMTTVSFALSPAQDLGVVTAGQVVAGVTIFFVVFDQIHSSTDLWHVAAVLVALGILLVLATPFTVAWSPNKLFGLSEFYNRVWPRLPKTTNPNILAGALAPIVPIALALIVSGERRWRMLGATALAPLIITLVLLQSRGALFALAIGLGIWVALYRRWVVPLIPLALLAALVVNAMIPDGVPLTQVVYGNIGTSTAGSFVQRQDLWIQAIYLIRASPFVGIGLGAYPRIAPYAWPYSPAQPGLIVTHAHNLFLQVALDTGILGLAAFVVVMLLAMRSAWNAYRSDAARHLAIGALAAFAVLWVHGMGDVVVWGTKSSIVLWILLALAIGFDKIRAVR